MADLKQKFIDILFEDVPEDEDGKKEEKIDLPKKESSIKASDILYRKSGTSAFINLDEPKRDYSIEEVLDNNEYELSSQISPIFGIIKEAKKTSVNSNDINESQIKKPEDSHLDIITSPIYGYGNGTNNDQHYQYEEENEEKSLHELFDDDAYLDSSYTNEEAKQSPGEDSEEISLFKLFGENK